MKTISIALTMSIVASGSIAETILTDSPPMFAITSALSLSSSQEEIGLAIDPNQSLHHFSLKPSQARAISKATTLVTIGADLFPQINDAFTNLNPEAIVISIEELLANDPHFWMSPKMVIQAADVIDAQLPSRDPSGELAQGFEQSMLDIDEQISQIIFNRGIIVGHDAFSGFINAYNIPYFGALTDEHDHAASAKDHHAIDEAIENGDASCLVLDTSEPSPDLEKFATEHGINFVYVDVLGWSFIEPSSEQFFAKFYAQLGQAFSTCAISELVPLNAQ